MGKSNKGAWALLGGLAFFAVLILCFIGWVANIVKIFNAGSVEFTGEMILRIIGIIIAPLGAIMGLFF